MGEDEGGGGQKEFNSPLPFIPSHQTRGGEVLGEFIWEMLEENSQIAQVGI